MSSSDDPITTDEMDEAGEPESQEQPPQQPPEWDRLALFVDCARVWADDVEDALEDIIARAERVEGRVYHSWSRQGGANADPASRASKNTEHWAEFCGDYDLEQVEMPQISATGIQITLDAVDLEETVDAVCVLTVSHQIGPLFERLREQGVYVVGLSNWRARDEFRNACDEFAVVDDRAMSQARQQAENHRAEGSGWGDRVSDLCDNLRSGPTAWVPLPMLQQCLNEIYPEFETQLYGDETLDEWLGGQENLFALRDWRDRYTGETTLQVRSRRKPQARNRAARTGEPPAPRGAAPDAPPRSGPWEEIVAEALRQEPRDEGGWIQMPRLGQRLHQLDPHWSPKRHGAEKLLDLLDRRDDLFEIEEEMDDDDRKVLSHWVRLAPTAPDDDTADSSPSSSDPDPSPF